MAAGDAMQGRRVPESAEPWKYEAGDYGLRKTEDEYHAGLWVSLPNGVGPCRLDGWEIAEHDDGTITASPSILDNDTGWHGFLERGVWREV